MFHKRRVPLGITYIPQPWQSHWSKRQGNLGGHNTPFELKIHICARLSLMPVITPGSPFSCADDPFRVPGWHTSVYVTLQPAGQCRPAALVVDIMAWSSTAELEGSLALGAAAAGRVGPPTLESHLPLGVLPKRPSPTWLVWDCRPLSDFPAQVLIPDVLT